MTRIAVLDDYQGVAKAMANWSVVESQAEVVVFHEYLNPETQLIEALKDFDIICIMRERTRLDAEVLKHLTSLKLLITTGAKNAAIDMTAATQLGITVCGTQSPGHAASELAWGLIMTLSRHIIAENDAMRCGLWQTTLGRELNGQTLGIIGLGRHGTNMARYAKAFNMHVIAWSENLTQEHCDKLGVIKAEKETLAQQSDFISIHVRMGQRYQGLIDENFLNLMKPTTYLVNTSRGPIINETALISALKNKKIAGAGLDVYDQEPLPKDHYLRTLSNTVLTSHVGFVTQQTYKVFYEQTVEAILAWLAGSPVRVISSSGQ